MYAFIQINKSCLDYISSSLFVVFVCVCVCATVRLSYSLLYGFFSFYAIFYCLSVSVFFFVYLFFVLVLLIISIVCGLQCAEIERGHGLKSSQTIQMCTTTIRRTTENHPRIMITVSHIYQDGKYIILFTGILDVFFEFVFLLIQPILWDTFRLHLAYKRFVVVVCRCYGFLEVRYIK